MGELREQVIEATALALAESYSPDAGLILWVDQAPYWRVQAGVALDSILEGLGRRREEWVDSAKLEGPGLHHVPMSSLVPNMEAAARLLNVLRAEGQQQG